MDNRILITGQPGLRRQERYTGFYMEREKLPLRCATAFRATGIQGIRKGAEAQGVTD